MQSIDMFIALRNVGKKSRMRDAPLFSHNDSADFPIGGRIIRIRVGKLHINVAASVFRCLA